LQAGIVEEDLLHVFCLGRRPENEDIPRPLLVQLASYYQKNVIMESLYTLKHSETQFKRTVVAHDMTRLEKTGMQEASGRCKKLGCSL